MHINSLHLIESAKDLRLNKSIENLITCLMSNSIVTLVKPIECMSIYCTKRSLSLINKELLFYKHSL